MTTEVTTASPETTVDSADTSQTTQATEVTQSTETTTPETKTDDYSYVPKKFLKDGKPDWENLSKSYQNLEKKISTKGAFAPETADEYEFSPSSADYQLDQSRVSAFKEEAKAAGLSTEQYKFVMSKYESLVAENAITAEKSEAVLKQDWGNAFDTNLRAAQKAFSEFAPSDVSSEDPILNHPTVLKLLARIGMELGEDGTPAKSTPQPSTSSQEIEDIIKSGKHWNDPELYKKVEAYYAKAYNKQ